MTLHVVDESCPERRQAIQIVIFLPTIEKMPKVLVRLMPAYPNESIFTLTNSSASS